MLICFADWFANKSRLKENTENEINEESIRTYLNPERENPRAVKIANVVACFMIAIFAVIQLKTNLDNQEKMKKKIETSIENIIDRVNKMPSENDNRPNLKSE